MNRGLTEFGRFAEPTLYILVSLGDSPKHGYAIMTDVEAMTGEPLGPGTLYGARVGDASAERGQVAPRVVDVPQTPVAASTVLSMSSGCTWLAKGCRRRPAPGRGSGWRARSSWSRGACTPPRRRWSAAGRSRSDGRRPCSSPYGDDGSRQGREQQGRGAGDRERRTRVARSIVEEPAQAAADQAADVPADRDPGDREGDHEVHHEPAPCPTRWAGRAAARREQRRHQAEDRARAPTVRVRLLQQRARRAPEPTDRVQPENARARSASPGSAPGAEAPHVEGDVGCSRAGTCR